MKSAIFILSILILTNASVDPMACILQITSAYSQLSSKIRSAAEDLQVSEVLVYSKVLTSQKSIEIISSTLGACGVQIPEFHLDSNLTKSCFQGSFELKEQLVGLILDSVHLGLTNTSIPQLQELIHSFSQNLQVCEKAGNSLTVDNQTIFDLPITTLPISCLDSFLDFAKTADITNMTTFMNYITSNQSLQTLKNISQQCEIPVPHYNFSQVQKCKSLIMGMPFVDMYTEIMKNGLDQNVALQALGLVSQMSQIKEVCMDAFQSFEMLLMKKEQVFQPEQILLNEQVFQSEQVFQRELTGAEDLQDNNCQENCKNQYNEAVKQCKNQYVCTLMAQNTFINCHNGC